MNHEVDGKWCEQMVRLLNLDRGRILDVGSQDINGTCRRYFGHSGKAHEYIGIDNLAGPCVDIVMNSNNLLFPDGHFNTVLCFSMLEHTPDPIPCLKEMYRVLKPGGTLLVSIPSFGFQKHDYPGDFWRVSDTGLKIWLQEAGFTSVHAEHITDARNIRIDLENKEEWAAYHNVQGVSAHLLIQIAVGWATK